MAKLSARALRAQVPFGCVKSIWTKAAKPRFDRAAVRDFFAIIAIILTVVGLGVFRVPDENALVAAGIKAAADGAVYQEKHPIRISVKGREVTASGRVETEAEAQAIETRLAALDGVETVIGDWVVLPNAAPFSIQLTKSEAGITTQGFVPDESVLAALQATLGLEQSALVVAAGVPDADWSGLVQRAAGALVQMVEGTVRGVDRNLTLSGTVPLPRHAAAISAGLADVPDGYEVTLEISAQDDGLPYSLFLARDPLMGVRYTGKMPPDFDAAGLNALTGHVVGSVRMASVDLDVQTFEPMVNTALQMFALVEDGAITISPEVLSIQGGPMTPAAIEQINALGQTLPQGTVFNAALTPQDDGIPLSLQATWDGQSLSVQGHVPSTFLASDDDAPKAAFLKRAGFGQAVALDVTYARHPDLQDWDAPFWKALSGLAALEAGVLVYDTDGVRLTGTAANPQARRRADLVLGKGADLDILLLDDGDPPRFQLRFDVATGAVIEGKLPSGLTPQDLAEALGGFEIRGKLPVSPDGNGAQMLMVLASLQGWLSEIDSVTVDYSLEGVAVEVTAMPGQDEQALMAALRQSLPPGTDLSMRAAPIPLEGARRMHVVLQQPQIFADGYWMPSLSFAPNVETCTAQMALVPQIPFATGRFVPGFGAERALAHMAAVLRTCTRFGNLTALITAEVSSSEVSALNRQLSRRRTESLRRAMMARGVDAERMAAQVADQTQGADRIVVSWR